MAPSLCEPSQSCQKRNRFSFELASSDSGKSQMGFVVPIILEVRKRGRGNVSRDEARSTKQFGKSGLTHVAGIYILMFIYLFVYSPTFSVREANFPRWCTSAFFTPEPTSQGADPSSQYSNAKDKICVCYVSTSSYSTSCQLIHKYYSYLTQQYQEG